MQGKRTVSRSFDYRNTYSEQRLTELNLGLVVATAPVDEIKPGLQVHMCMLDGVVRLDNTGVVAVDRNYAAVGARVIHQAAYAASFEPGNAGVWFNPAVQRTEALASRSVVEHLQTVDPTDYIGFVHMVDCEGVPVGEKEFSDNSARERLSVLDVFGVTVENVAEMIAPQTLDNLVDPIQHEVVGPWLQQYGLRSSVGA